MALNASDSRGGEGAYQGLIFRVDSRTVEGMTRHNIYVGWEVLFEGLDLGVFTGRLAADNGAQFRCCVECKNR